MTSIITTNEGKEIDIRGLSSVEIFKKGREYERGFHRENPAAPDVYCEVDGMKCFVFDKTWSIYGVKDGKSARIGHVLHCCPKGQGDAHNEEGHTVRLSTYEPLLKYQWDDFDIYRQWVRLRRGDSLWSLIFVAMGIVLVLAILGAITNTFG